MLRIARSWAVVGNFIGISSIVFADYVSRIAQLDAGALRVIGGSYLLLTAIAYFTGVHASKHPFIQEID